MLQTAEYPNQPSHDPLVEDFSRGTLAQQSVLWTTSQTISYRYDACTWNKVVFSLFFQSTGK